MLIYHIGIFNTQTKKITTILCLPEKRRDSKRITKNSIDKWIKSIMGYEWWNKYWAKVSINKRRVN